MLLITRGRKRCIFISAVFSIQSRFCSGVSAIKCTRPGGRSGIPTLPILEKFLATGEIDGTELDERVRHYKYGLLNA